MTIIRDTVDLVHAADPPMARAGAAVMPIAARAARYRPEIDGLRAVAVVRTRLREVAATSGAVVIDPREALCTGMNCAATNARGLPVHSDSNHLTAAFAREHATFIDGILLAPAAAGRVP